MEESKPAAEAPVVETPVVETPAAPEITPAPTETIGQVLEQPTVEEKPAPKVVPEAAFLEMKKDNKELRKEIADLRKSIEGGADKAEVSADIAAIGEKYGVDKSFLSELASTIRKDVEHDTATRLEPITAKEREERIDKAFSAHFDKAMADMPEFASIADRETIKALSLLPKNANKTFAQLIEDTYGKAVPGKRTLETTTPRGGKTFDSVDAKRAAQDPAYLKEVLANPETRKEYNDGLVERLSTSL